MAKKKTTTKRFSIQGFDAAHYRTTEQYANAVNTLFDRATAEITKAAAAGTYDPDKPFSFADYPGMNKTVESVTKQLATNVQVVIETGSKKQWLFACQKNDKYLASIMDTSKLSKARLAKMQDRNLDALGSFQQRKVDGMDLSQRVWKYVGQYKEQMESALDVGLGEGRSAQQLARDVKQNLRDPTRLFRRVRDKRGNLVLSKNAQAFHPGRGVYRSSVKNAQRLTRSEINMAYRESDWQRWQQLDFVIGFEIHRSNHDPLCKCSLCERLVGRYPKWFKFKGFHPQCMCFCTPILMDEETFDENELGDLKSALFGTEYEHQAAKNAVVDVPDGFKEWVKDNIEAQDNWSSTPYFIRDNFVDGSLAKGLKVTPETYVDPWEEQLAALQPSIIAAKALAQQWGLDGQIVDLDAAITNKDAKSINATILRINTICKQYQRDYSAFVSDANATLEELANLGVDILGEEKTRLQRYLDTLANDKTQWSKNGSFYQSDLDELKEKIKSYKASPLASMPLSYQKEVADIRNRIAKAKEWGIKTADADAALRTFLDNPTRENYYQMQNAEFKLWDKIHAAENKVLKLISDANALMKDAAQYSINTTDMSRWVFNLQGSDKSFVWAQYKRDINKCYNDLKAAVDAAINGKKEQEVAKQGDVLNPKFTGTPHPAVKTSYSNDAEVNETFKAINSEFTTEKWFERGDLILTPTTRSGVNGFTSMNGKISLTTERLALVKSALGKIGQKKSGDITFEEADAMATFWHEITHNRNTASWRDSDKTSLQTRCMELANEFVARHTLPEFYAKLGASSLPHPEFQTNRDSTGYNQMVTNYDYVISKLGLNHNKVLLSVRSHLYTGGYNDQQTGLLQGLLDGGLTYANGKAVKKSDLNALIKLIRTQENVYDYDMSAHKFVTVKTKEDVILAWLVEHGFC